MNSTNKLISAYRRLCDVKLPPFKARQKYMHSFDLASPVMAEGYEDYLQPVSDLCEAAGAIRGVAHMTVDEKIIEAGMSQRRPGPHVDGCYYPSLGHWGGGGGGWNHYCNNVPLRRMPIIVAATVAGCLAWSGEFDAIPTDSGDLSHAADLLGEPELIPANCGYLLSPDCIHESIRFDQPTQRTFLRIALPVDFQPRV